MTFYQPLLTTINHLIQRIDKVKVCQDHWKIVEASLVILQLQLNEKDKMNDVRKLHEEIEQTLKAIDEVVTSCTEREIDLNGVTYRDFESLLLRFQLRLAQHEADLTDDYETKVQILCNAYHKQQIFTQKVLDETMRQRLDTIEKHTKEKTIEQLNQLRKKYFDTIEIYLHQCTDQHKSVPLTGLTADIIAKVADNFYQISPEYQVQLRQKWRACELPLTRTFIQLKPDKSSSFERNESRRLLMENEANMVQGAHSRKETSKGIWERLVSAPYMMSMVERDRYSEEDDVTEENIIRSKRWIVILGDPGSGKTSFARWLVHHLAQTLLINGSDSTDYGPLRIPILIRIGEFAEILKEQPSLTLFDYIGKHKWMGKSIVDDSLISSNNVSCALQDYIKQGQALIILDGLDEIPLSNQRSKIINIVENFVDTYVQTPTGVSVFDNVYLSKLLDDPSRSGGNQLIVTSRIVGYHAAPLAGQFAHYTIRPMDMEHMRDFVDYWFYRVHQHIIDTLGLPLTNQGERHGEILKKELEKTENTGLLDVASNSCLMSFICSVAFNQLEGSSLPTQRILLYEAIVNSMLSLWTTKTSTIPIRELIQIFSNIATYIHGNSASGLIHEEKMKEICIQSIKNSSRKNFDTKKNIQDIGNQASEFVRIIRDDVGILAARGESLYGFLHLTFQEYFTCLKLIDIETTKQEKEKSYESGLQNKVQLLAQSVRYHTNDPRFQVPIALALGKISSSWSQKDFDNFSYEFIKMQDESDSLLPLGAYMLISCGNDLVNYPSHNVLFDALDRLIIAAGQHKWSIVCPFLFDQITAVLKKLRNDIIPLWIHNLLLRSYSHNIQTVSALCRLIEGKPHEFENIKWLNQSSCSILQSLSILDNENNEFAIDRLLVKIAFSNRRLLSVHPMTFKEFLLGNEIELNSIPVNLFPVIISLYGGLKRDGHSVVFDPFHIYRESTAVTKIFVRFLSENNLNIQDEKIMLIKQECLRSLLTRIENHEESPETVDLCIATICLYGIDYVTENTKIISNSLFRMSLGRLKYISMILRQYYFVHGSDSLHEKEATKFISMVIQKFQYGELSNVQFLDLLNSIRSGLARLQSSTTSILLEGKSISDKRVTLNLPNSLRKENKFLDNILFADVSFYLDQKSCLLLHHFTKLFWILEHNEEFDTQYRMALAMDTIPEYLLFRHDEDLLFPFTFVSSHLQNLYIRLLEQRFIVISSKDFIIKDRYHLYFEHILLECLMLLSHTLCKRLSILAALIALLPWLRMHRLENIGSSLLWTFATKDSSYLSEFEATKQRPINYETGLYINKLEHFVPANDMTDEERKALMKECIEQEQHRLEYALTDNDERSMKLYSACISLACICRWTEEENQLSLLEESVQGAMSITNKLSRLDALCMIAFYSRLGYKEIQVNGNRSLQKEIEYQFNEIYSELPLLLHTAIFIRCLPLLRHQQTIDICAKNLANKFATAEYEDQHVVYEALSPYLRSHIAISQMREFLLNYLPASNISMNNRSSVLMKYMNMKINETILFSPIVANMYLVELTSDFHKYLTADFHQLSVLHDDFYTVDKSIVTTLFGFDNPILTVAQAVMISNFLLSVSSSNRSKHSKMLCVVLSNTLHRFNSIEFKACRLVESWMKWKDSNEFSSFACHAALLLTNSDLWSVEAAIIICDLLCCENDRFRQRAEIILRSTSNDNDIRTSSKLGISVFLTLTTKKSHYQYSSPSANLTLSRVFEDITLDNRFHLNTILWLERYRNYVLFNKEYSINKSKLSSISHAVSYFPTDFTIEVSFCETIRLVSKDLIQYMCDLIISNFLSFLEIDGDTTSNAVVESHIRFVVSVLICIGTLFNHTFKSRALLINALVILYETSTKNDIRRAVVYALSYICNERTYKILFNQLQVAMNNDTIEASNNSDDIIAILISSYCHCVCIEKIVFDQDDIALFRKLLKHPSKNVLTASYVGLGRVLKDNSLLFEMLDFDYIQCYHALIGSTAYLLIYDCWEGNMNAVVKLIEEHPDLLPIFIVELYNSIRHFTDNVIYVRTIDCCLNYGNLRYVEVASLIAIRMPATFCAYIKDSHDGDNLKHALFYTSKQHDFPQRAACLTILSIFGELTVELCEMLIYGLRDDPHIQNTCYKCLNRIISIKNEKEVLNLLFSYLKSKSMNTRYVAAKMLLHLSKYSLVPFNQVRTVLNELILDPDSNEGLWLIKEQDSVITDCAYDYVGPLKDVIYSLLIQHLTNDVSGIIRRNLLNDINSNFVESEKVSRLAACFYEEKTSDIQIDMPLKIKTID
ncbi:unnamed protein product [Rotaria sp. Silwood2]|nr:unnamed protein product [Rotaria sp. Silwood2]CAF2673471.1 unnamed protein product [Rotaria sp. Silwood2]CAF4011526.1 unnamed protein product [Rotaria sp. Silwood2]